MAKAEKVKGHGKRTPLGDWLWKYAEDARLDSYKKLSDATKIPVSTIHMFSTGNRKISPSTWSRLVGALRPERLPIRQFTEEFLRLAGYRNGKAYLSQESRLERAVREGHLNAVAMTSEPFVEPGEPESGFAVSLVREIARVLGVKDVKFTRGKLGGLHRVFDNPAIDVAVTAVLPTFRKSRLIAFSKPFPFLRIGLSAVTTKRVLEKRAISIHELLDWDTAIGFRESAKLEEVHFAFAKGGAAHDFVTGFSPEIITSKKEISLEEPTVDDLLHDLTANKKDVVVIADLATCQAIIDKSEGMVRPVPRDPSDVSGKFVKPEKAESELEYLASYPITFGLPLADLAWVETFNNAMEYLLTERIRPLLRVYARYLSNPAFRAAFDPNDNLYPAPDVQAKFKKLIAPQVDPDQAQLMIRVSIDGGLTWGPEVLASAVPAEDRKPGASRPIKRGKA